MEQGIRPDIFRCPRISQQKSKQRHKVTVTTNSIEHYKQLGLDTTSYE